MRHFFWSAVYQITYVDPLCFSYLAKRCQHVFQVVMVNETIAILIDHVERLLELLDLILIEHSKDVRSGPLGTLLRPSPSGRFSTRHC